MLGIINPNGYEKVNRVYSSGGVSPTITARDYKDPIKVLDMSKKRNIMADSTAQHSTAQHSLNCCVIGCMDNSKDHTYESANRIYSRYGLSPTIPTNCGGDHLPKVIEKI